MDGGYEHLGGAGDRGMSRAFSWLVRCLAALQCVCPAQRPSIRNIITPVLVCAAVMCIIFISVTRSSSANPWQQLPASAECADPQDVLTPSTGLCKASNVWALAYLEGKGYSECGKGLPGVDVLRENQDSSNNYWYPYSQRDKVRQVYRSCTPICATQDDTYHSQSQMCIVRNPVARMWLAGYGQKCDSSSRGATFISKASTEGNGITAKSKAPVYIYAPINAWSVGKFYMTCKPTCALGDTLMKDNVHCNVKDGDALAFFGDGNERCLNKGPGVSSISNTKDAGFYYPQKMGPVIQAWYLTCKRGAGGGGAGGGGGGDTTTKAAYSRAVAGDAARPPSKALNIMFPYPKEASADVVQICNYSGKRYYYQGGKEAAGMVTVESLNVGNKCQSIALADACASEDCWRRGHVAPCETGLCFVGSRKAVTAGITLVSTGDGAAVCTVVCMGTADACKTNSVVYISPAHCAYVQVLPTQTQVVDFPAPYDYLPKLVFPYPTEWTPFGGGKAVGLTDTTITICNWSGHNYWFSTGDDTEEAWKHGAAATMVKALGKDGNNKCVVIKTAEESWRRGYVAPCADGETVCARAAAQEVHAGVNVVNPSKGGVGLCTVECEASTDVCRTTTVVFISPAKCDKVHVASL